MDYNTAIRLAPRPAATAHPPGYPTFEPGPSTYHTGGPNYPIQPPYTTPSRYLPPSYQPPYPSQAHYNDQTWSSNAPGPNDRTISPLQTHPYMPYQSATHVTNIRQDGGNSPADQRPFHAPVGGHPIRSPDILHGVSTGQNSPINSYEQGYYQPPPRWQNEGSRPNQQSWHSPADAPRHLNTVSF